MSIRKMLWIALSVSIIIVQEYSLILIPNVQFTVLLIILFSSVFTLKEGLIMVFVYVLLDNLLMGTMNIFYIVPMLLAWSIIPVLYHAYLKRFDGVLHLSVFAFVFGFIYGWVFIPFRMIQYGIADFRPYLIADLPFEIIMATFGFLTILWAYAPLKRVMDNLVHEEIMTASNSYK